MPTDYASVRVDNERRYGTDIGRIGPMLLAERYDDRTHFIFELLQNAEDALARRQDWQGSRAVRFTLSEADLRTAHFGKPFDYSDVRGICGIAESTKDSIAIGRFGIGFKSVYAFTDRPEVHSGGEDFAIESYVWPTAIPAINRQTDETVFILPLREGDEEAHTEIVEGLRRLGARTLLFLRQIEEIDWSVEGGPSGLYVRDKPEEIGEDVHRILLLGEEHGKPDVEETWLLFSEEVKTPVGMVAGRAEIAFSVVQEKTSNRWSVQCVSDSPLVVFFPTVLPTHLGFLVQGPYRTTPSRDNVPRSDRWNQHLVTCSATLLVHALRWLRDNDMLDTTALNCLPLDSTRFGAGTRFSPLFEATRTALASEPLLPCFGGNYAPSSKSRIARTQELRDLFGPSQLAGLLDHDGELVWLSGDISLDRTPELRQYLMRELNIAEVTPESVVSGLNKSFLQAQSDGWILALYEFLNGQPALRRRLDALPLIRLEDGSHVTVRSNGEPLAFLPGAAETSFPTVRQAVCATADARQFLQSLGLTEPNLVDDVVRNILPKYLPRNVFLPEYRTDEGIVSDSDYEADIRRIMSAFGTDSKEQREKLAESLRSAPFVRAVDAGDGHRLMSKPDGVYLATERLKALFAGVPDVLLVDDTVACLRGEDIREMLEACGAIRYLRPIVTNSRSREDLRQLRAQFGQPMTSGHSDRITDWTLSGLEGLLDRLPGFDVSHRKEKATLLWEELAHLEERRGKGVFSGEYTWMYHVRFCVSFDAAFVCLLNDAAWVPDAIGELQRPGAILFDALGWKQDPFLLDKIRFRSPIIDQLAKEAGIEPGVLDLLKTLGLTSVDELRDRLRLPNEPPTAGDEPADDVPNPVEPEPPRSENGHAGIDRGIGKERNKGGGRDTGERSDGQDRDRTDSTGTGPTAGVPGGAGGRLFISYVAAHPDEERDPDGLDHAARMALEERAIELILVNEPNWQRMPTNNPGYDLFEPGNAEKQARWCEVKAMKGSFRDRPVGLSSTQFDAARELGEAYWLYVVERAGATGTRIVRIRNPAGNARTYTFDQGWLEIADVDGGQDDLES